MPFRSALFAATVVTFAATQGFEDVAASDLTSPAAVFIAKCVDKGGSKNYCSSWCNTPGKWDCGTPNDGAYQCDCQGCNGCGVIPTPSPTPTPTPTPTPSSASTVYIIRHGEKNSAGDLSDQGLARAQNLLKLFNGALFQQPKALFAGKYSDGSPQRTLHTIQPLGSSLHESINNDIHVEYHQPAAQAIRKKLEEGAGVVLASWEHCNIAGVVEALGVDKQNKCDSVSGWASNDYDSVYVLVFQSPTSKPSFRHAQQNFHLYENSTATSDIII